MKTRFSIAFASLFLALIAVFVLFDGVHDNHAFAAQTNTASQQNQPAQKAADGIKIELNVPSQVYATVLTPIKMKVTDENSGSPLSHVDWAIVVKDPHGNIVYKTTTGHSHAGIMDFNVAFPMGGQNTISLTTSSIGSQMMGMDVPLMARTHTMDSGSLMTFEKDPENNFGSRTYEFPVYVLPQKQSKVIQGSEQGTKINVELATTSDEIIAGRPTTLLLTLTQPNGEMLTHPDALISVRKGAYLLSDSADPGDPMMPMNGAYHGHLGQMSYTASFPSAGNYVVNVDLNSLPVSNLQFGKASARFNVLVSEPEVTSESTTSQVSQNQVNILGLEAPFYTPNTINAKVGQKITFDNIDANFHTVTSGTPESGPSGSFDSGLLKAGDKYDLTLDKAGTYNYFCTIHTNMQGTIVVS